MQTEENHKAEHVVINDSRLNKYLSPINIWALSFGCAVGWGAFVMPGTTFLPIAGPLGTALGMAVGALVMLVIGYNYHYMMNRYPEAGGTYSYAKNVLGYDHGFLSAWFLVMAYIAITWANATAIPLVFRNLMGDVFQFGHLYKIAGYDVYIGEALLSLGTIWLCNFICIRGGKVVAYVQTVAAFILFIGVTVGFCAAMNAHGGNISDFEPLFSPADTPLGAIFGIAVLSPWAFVGFESISHSTEEFKFSVTKSFSILFIAVITSALAYIFLAIMAASVLPAGYPTWVEYIADINHLNGYAGLPTFFAVHSLLGDGGMAVLALTLIAAVITGLVGNSIAASRLIYAVARDDVIANKLKQLGKYKTPKNVFMFLMLMSLPIPFLGRTAIGWIVDVNTVGATIAYAYASGVAFFLAKNDGNKKVQVTGLIGMVTSVIFFLYFMIPNFWAINAMSAESYIMLMGWSVLGFIVFRYIFQKDKKNHFGKSTIAWMALLFLIFFTSTMWLRQSTHDTTKTVLNNLNAYYLEELKEHGAMLNPREQADAEYYLAGQMEHVSFSLTTFNALQMTLLVITLAIMFSIYNMMNKREKLMEIKKVEAEQSNKAKSTFLFNMSHDIRTPMNAIIGYVNLAKKEKGASDTVKDYLTKIEASSDHLLALINDILEMSRIENGKMELEIEKFNLVKIMNEVYDLFITQMQTKNISYTVNAENITNKTVMCDKNRLNRVLLNLISNAFKFTPSGGSVTVTLAQKGGNDTNGFYELRVKDTGMGMTPEFAEKVFEAYTRDRTVNNIQGTGLGMAITKSIVDLMHGSIDVETEFGKGTEFTVNVSFPIAEDEPEVEENPADNAESEIDFSKIKLLLVEDIEVNREIATLILDEFGFQIETAENGKVAVEKIAASKPGEFQLILMDIQMPIMNGYEAAKAIRALPDPQLSSIPIIAMTANAFAEDVQNAKDAGMNDHVAKPLDVTQMMTTITSVLSHHD
ncbi:MAG: amino acid permease [Selenomonadaceae bacterium]|nr:amino acid permease [Selenomonadaceae bacterium]